MHSYQAITRRTFKLGLTLPRIPTVRLSSDPRFWGLVRTRLHGATDLIPSIWVSGLTKSRRMGFGTGLLRRWFKLTFGAMYYCVESRKNDYFCRIMVWVQDVFQMEEPWGCVAKPWHGVVSQETEFTKHTATEDEMATQHKAVPAALWYKYVSEVGIAYEAACRTRRNGNYLWACASGNL